MWFVVAFVVVLLFALFAFRHRIVAFGQHVVVGRAREMFKLEREQLEAKFLRAAAASGKPRGLRWMECQWEDQIQFALERETALVTALVGVTIRFEAIEGGDMEGLPAVGNLRNASAVFYFDKGHWHTVGRTVFNLNPDEALEHFGPQYERLS